MRRHFPDAHLEVVGYPHIVELAMLGGVVDRVQPIEARGLAGFFARNGTLDAVLSDYFSGFEIIIASRLLLLRYSCKLFFFSSELLPAYLSG